MGSALVLIAIYLLSTNKIINTLPQNPSVALTEVRQRPIEKALTLTDESLIPVSQFEKIVTENSKEISRVFFRISSGILFNCDALIQKCEMLKSPRSSLDLSKYQSILNKYSIPAVLIYDLNINNFGYRFEKFKSPSVDGTTNAKQENIGRAKVVFSPLVKQKAILQDFNEKLKLMKFEKIVFGYDLNLFFYSIFGNKTRQEEIKSFWSLLKKIKSENPENGISSSFNFEHMKYYNFWSELGRAEIEELDFISFSSRPLHPGWSLFPKYAEQLTGFTVQTIAELDYNYFSVIRQKLISAKEVYFVDFGYPEDESKEQNRLLLIKHLQSNPIIKCLSWILIPTMSGDSPEAKYSNALSLIDKDGNLNESGKLFFSSDKSN